MSTQSAIKVGTLVLSLVVFKSLVQAAAPSWENISPPGVDYSFVNISNYGFCGLDGAMPDQPKTIYVGTCVNQGIWKTTNAGQTWLKASTGINGNLIDGRNWSVAVDPFNSDVVYTNCGFGFRQGVWKSTNGGVDWTQIQGTIDNNDVQGICIDPLNGRNILVTLHSGSYGLWESTNGGTTWTGKGAPWGSHSACAFFLGRDDNGNPSSKCWLGMVEGAGLWRTVDEGANWTQVSTTFSRSHAGAGLYRAPNGTLYGCVNSTIARSTDNGKTWADLHVIGNLPNTCDGYAGIISDGTNIWTMPENTGVAVCGPYKWLITSESGDGTNWTTYNNQTFINGAGEMVFDSINRIIYANLQCAGIWKLQLGATQAKPANSIQPIQSGRSTSNSIDLQGRFVTNRSGVVSAAGKVSGQRASGVTIMQLPNGKLQKSIQMR